MPRCRSGSHPVRRSNDAVGKWRGPNSRVIDSHGATLLPGLIDSHVHILEPGRTVRGVERLRAWCEGFSWHAGVVIAGHDRDALERLCRDGAMGDHAS